MILALPAGSMLRVHTRQRRQLLICEECGGELVLSASPRALMLHAATCRTLALLRDASARKPLFVRHAGLVTEVFHEARARVA